MARRTLVSKLENPVVKRFLVVGVLLGTSLLVVGIGAALGVLLGSRALVVSAEAVQPVAALSAAPSHLGSPPAVVAMGE
jgi:hypothetical protein